MMATGEGRRYDMREKGGGREAASQASSSPASFFAAFNFLVLTQFKIPDERGSEEVRQIRRAPSPFLGAAGL